MTVEGVCRFIAIMLHNPKRTLDQLQFDHMPSACAMHPAWRREGLPVPRKGKFFASFAEWSSVLSCLSSSVRHVRTVHDATQMSRSILFTSQTSICTNSSPQLSSLSAKLCHSMSLVLNAAAASLVFGRSGARARTLLPSAQFGFTMSQRSFELASLQWCRSPGSVTRKQHAWLVCCSCPLSMLASRLAHAVNWRESNRSFAHKAIARIMKQCFSVTARWLWYAHYAAGS